MSDITINHGLIHQEGSGSSIQIKPSTSAAYGPYDDLVTAQSGLVAAFGSMTNIPKGYTFCVIEETKPVEYWFIMNGVATTTTPFANQVEKKQKESNVSLSDLQFRINSETIPATLEFSTDGGSNWTPCGTVPAAVSDITQLKVRVCTDEGENYGQIQVNYNNGAAGYWNSVGARDDSRLKPLTDMQFMVNPETNQLQVYYGSGEYQPIDGAIFNNGGGETGRGYYIVDYNTVSTLSPYEGHTYTGQNAVDALVAAATDFPIQFNIWMAQMFANLQRGTKVLFVSTLIDRTGGTTYTDVSNAPGYLGYRNTLNNAAVVPTTLDSIITNDALYNDSHPSSSEKQFYLYESVKISNTMWTGLVMIGKIYRDYYNQAPFAIEVFDGFGDPIGGTPTNVSVTYQWDAGTSAGGRDHTREHVNLTQGVTFNIASSVPFKMALPTTKDDSDNLFFVIKENGTPVVSDTMLSIGNHSFTIDVPAAFTASEYTFHDGTVYVSGVLKPAYQGMIDIVGMDENATYYGSIALHYYPTIDNSENVCELQLSVKDRYTYANISNAKVYQDGVLIGRTNTSGQSPAMYTAVGVATTYLVTADEYASDGDTNSGQDTVYNITLYLEPSIENSQDFTLKVAPQDATIWLDGVKQNNPQIYHDGILHRRVSVGSHTLYITAIDHEPHALETITVLANQAYEREISLTPLEHLTYTCTVVSTPSVSISGDTGNLVLYIKDNYNTPCTILKLVPARSYDDFTVNSITVNGIYTTANITFCAEEDSTAHNHSGEVLATVYYMGTDGTTLDTEGYQQRKHFNISMYPYLN